MALKVLNQTSLYNKEDLEHIWVLLAIDIDFAYTLEGSLIRLYLYFNVVSTWDISGLSKCEHDMQQTLSN